MFHPECQAWIEKMAKVVEAAMKSRHHHHALSHFTMAAPHSSGTCTTNCDDGILAMQETNKHYCLRWLHDNAKEYNGAIWLALNNIGAIDYIRRLVEADIKVEKKCQGEACFKGPNGECECNDYGLVILKSLGQELLDHFLIPNPSPDWVGSWTADYARGYIR